MLYDASRKLTIFVQAMDVILLETNHTTVVFAAELAALNLFISGSGVTSGVRNIHSRKTRIAQDENPGPVLLHFAFLRRVERAR